MKFIILQALLLSLLPLTTASTSPFGTGSAICQGSCSRNSYAVQLCANANTPDSTCWCTSDTKWASDLAICVRCIAAYNQTYANELGQLEGICGTPPNPADLCSAQCATAYRGSFACGLADTLNVACICAWDRNWNKDVKTCLDCLNSAGATSEAGAVESWQGLCAGGSSGSSSGSGGERSIEVPLMLSLGSFLLVHTVVVWVG